ncbi:competence protein [Mesorhizobium sp. Root554]|uniref:ComEC/Rec2 family competence protein n=1 Tax=unclassified Mesorhizobium TaxID=325217 RepID=UPI0006FACAA7|nr:MULTISPECIES: ComEC/Rec2 family competence protein [unclassified Mesorhizobium]KQZ13698.1 competence protein [Mesorhizobium sp. Root1471]KQZ36209.1 competence protein [Mesorhizobium sp. Root554]
MAGQGRGGKDSGKADRDVSERSLFAPTPAPDSHAGLRVDTAAMRSSPVTADDGAAASPLREPAHGPAPQGEILPAEYLPGKIQLSRPGPARWRLAQSLGRISVHDLVRGLAMASGTELDRGVGFLLVPVFLATGALFYFALASEPGFLQPVMCVVALACLMLACRSRPKMHLLFAVGFFCALGVLAAKVETWRGGGETLGSDISTRLTGRVVSIDELASGRVRLTLDVISTARPKLRYQPERVRLSARAIPAGTMAGSQVSGFVRLLPPTGPVRPGGYDFSFESYFEGLGGSGFFLSNPKLEPIKEVPLKARLATAVQNIRDAIAGRIRATIGGPEGEIAAALMVGVRAGIPEPINEAMRRTGIYHIISISGLHMALVAGTVMVMLRAAFALFPGFSSRRPVKKYAAAAALFSIAAYLSISGVVVAAERSFIMLAVMLTAVLFDRAALTMRNLAISAVIVILVSPHEVVGPSFQMSFAATAALVGAYAWWSDYRATKSSSGPPAERSLLADLTGRFFSAGVGIAATTIIAGSATALFAMWHFQRVSPLSLFANLAVMPIVSLAVMPFAVLSAIAMPFGADGPFLYVMGKGLTAMIAISDWISVRSPVDAVGLVSIQSVLLVTVALVIATVATTRLRLAAIPFALGGILAMPSVRTPDVLVSEDAHLIAMPIGGGELAVNRPKPNQFTIDNWRRALDAETVIGPETLKGEETRLATTGALDLPPGTPFLCTPDSCVARHVSGAIVARVKDERSARNACGFAALIVIDDATASDPCHDPLVAVITRQELAQSGSAAVYFASQSAAAPAEIQFAIVGDYRPWHVQRQFSREARGLPPFERRSRQDASRQRRNAEDEQNSEDE